MWKRFIIQQKNKRKKNWTRFFFSSWFFLFSWNEKEYPLICHFIVNLTNWWCDKTTWRLTVSSPLNDASLYFYYYFFYLKRFLFSSLSFIDCHLVWWVVRVYRPPPSSFPFLVLLIFLFLWIDDPENPTTTYVGIRPKWPIRLESKEKGTKDKTIPPSHLSIQVLYDIGFICHWVCLVVILGSWITRNCGWKTPPPLGYVGTTMASSASVCSYKRIKDRIGWEDIDGAWCVRMLLLDGLSSASLCHDDGCAALCIGRRGLDEGGGGL